MSPKKKEKEERQAITLEMISNYESQQREVCLFCGSYATKLLEGYAPSDIPKGFYFNAYRCGSCGRAWREITKLEEIL